ncbi:MAG: MBL fold metallo-hydrolase [Spirochaetia bacterium]|jgi:glyoxylase-like metal-dependent hydrolase (beta-lactamase superfamily II)
MAEPPAIRLTWFGTACFLILDGIDLVLVTHADPDHVNRLRFLPGIADIPIIAPPTVLTRFPDLRVTTDMPYRHGPHAGQMPSW